MYAIIETGSKQYQVKTGDTIDVELLTGNGSHEVTFEKVLLINSGNSVKVGKPQVSGAVVKGEIVAQIKDDKLMVFKYKRRKNYKVKKGHRQKLSRVKITAIEGGGAA